MVLTYLVVEDHLKAVGIGADGFPGDSLRSTGVPFGVLAGAGDLDGVDDGQERDSRNDDFVEHRLAGPQQRVLGRPKRTDASGHLRANVSRLGGNECK